MEPIWNTQGVLEYESLDGFMIRAERTERRLEVTATRDGRAGSITINLGPTVPADRHLPLDVLEQIAVGAWHDGITIPRLLRGEPRNYPRFDDEPRNRVMKKGKRRKR